MPSRGAVAASVRRSKEARPEAFCAVPGCLWRVVGRPGTPPSPCRKHPTAGIGKPRGS